MIFCISYQRQRRQWHPTPVLVPGKSHGWRSLVGCSPWGRWGSDTTEWLDFHFSLSCIGEGDGSPLQCSCLENPRDGGAWWASVCGVAQSRTRLKWLSSSSSISEMLKWRGGEVTSGLLKLSFWKHYVNLEIFYFFHFDPGFVECIFLATILFSCN